MKRTKSRLSFRLRTLLLLVLALGVPLAAWRAWMEPYRVQRAAIRAIADAGGHCLTTAGGPAWLRAVFGEGSFQEIVYVGVGQSADAEVLEHLFHLPSLSYLYVDCRAFTDDHLARLKRCPKLREAILIRTSVSPDSVETLRRGRPDMALKVRLSFEELAKVPANAPWNTDSARQEGVPTSVSQWVGRRIQIIGRPYDVYTSATKSAVGLFELAPNQSWMSEGRGVAVMLRSPIEPEDWCAWFEAPGVGVEGVLDIATDLSDYGASVYRLSDATLGIPYDPAHFLGIRIGGKWIGLLWTRAPSEGVNATLE